MEIIISGRGFDVSEDLKSYTTRKLTRLVEEYPKLTTARIVMETERNWQLVEARINGKGIELDATARTDDMYSSLDDIAEKLEKQLTKFRGKISKRRQSQKLAEAARSERALPREEDEPEEDAIPSDIDEVIVE